MPGDTTLDQWDEHNTTAAPPNDDTTSSEAEDADTDIEVDWDSEPSSNEQMDQGFLGSPNDKKQTEAQAENTRLSPVDEQEIQTSSEITSEFTSEITSEFTSEPAIIEEIPSGDAPHSRIERKNTIDDEMSMPVEEIVIPIIEAPTQMVQSANQASDSEDVSQKKVEAKIEATTEEVVVVTKEDVQDIKPTTSDSPVIVETDELAETEAKDTSMKLEEILQGEDEPVVFETEPANVSMGNISMEQIDVTEESFEQPSDLVVLTPTKEVSEAEPNTKPEAEPEAEPDAEPDAEPEAKSEALPEAIDSRPEALPDAVDDSIERGISDSNDIETAANCITADSIEGAISEINSEAINEEAEVPLRLIEVKVEASDESIEEEMGQLNEVPVIETPTVLVQSSLQPSDSEESEGDQTDDITINNESVNEDVTAPNKCDNAGPDVTVCQSPSADFSIPDTEGQSEKLKEDDEPTKENSEDIASEENNDERSTLLIAKASDSPPAMDKESEGQAEEPSDKSIVEPKDSAAPTPKKIISKDPSNLKLLTGQAMNLALSYATFIIKDSNLSHDLENYSNILNAAGVKIEALFLKSYVQYVQYCDVSSIIQQVSNGPSTGGMGSANVGAKDVEKTQENIPDKKPESESEEEDDFGFDLFG